MVRAKVKCYEKSEGGLLVLRPVAEGSAENEQFFKWTPSGEIRLGVMNPAALEQFEVGKEYYADFTPAEAPKEEPAAPEVAKEDPAS